MKCEKIYLKDYYDFLGENGKNPSVDMFLPFNMDEMDRENKKRPCMLIFSGGGYRGLSQREGEPMATNMLNEGFNVFVVNYSVAPHTFPSQLCEVAATIELIYKNADKWNCDTKKILVMGSSAGGHLAAHYSTMYDCKEVREYFPESKPVAGAVLNYPVITSNHKYWHCGSFQNLLGRENLTEEETKYFSCELNVKKTTPPTFIWCTRTDNLVPAKNSLLYADALGEHNVPYELHIYPFGAHGLATSDVHTLWGDPDKDPMFAHVNQWLGSLKKWLKYMDFCYKGNL